MWLASVRFYPAILNCDACLASKVIVDENFKSSFLLAEKCGCINII